ncbi:MAG: acyl-CoA dehydrogenase family protein [Sphingomonadaceae bacterium]
MNFELSDDQRMLKDSVERLVRDKYQFEQRLGYTSAPRGWSDEIWQDFVELGLTMLPFPEDQGGLGLGGVEMMIVGQAFGSGLVIEPYLPSVVLGGTAISFGAGAQAESLLSPIMTGETIAALADEATVTRNGDRLSGTAKLVPGGDSARLFVIADGEGGWLVPADSAGLEIRKYRLHGGGGAADLVLQDVSVAHATRLADGSITRAQEAGIAFLAAEAAGIMQAALDGTVEYLKTREQFGKPIGSNQALQHKAAEMLVEVEQAHSAAIYAALLSGETSPQERARGMAAVKAVIGKTGRFVGQNAVQLHGGIGVSEEHIVSHYFRRLTAISMILGDTGTQLKRLARLGGFTGPEDHLAA